MIIYIDLLFLLNFIFDFIILKTVDKVLKRNTSNKRILLSSLIGELSILVLIIQANYLLLFLCKAILAVIMNIIAFKYKDIKYIITNLLFFYMISIILGGFIYFLKEKNINYFIVILISPVILYLYDKQSKLLKIRIHNNYQVSITFNNNKKMVVNGYLDTGNTLIDPISKKKIVILDKRLTKGIIQNKSPIYVPIKVVNHVSLLKCIKIKYLEFNNNKYKDVLLGISNDKLNFNGCECLLNIKLMEE